jgi:organic hydroperoxide reductase OsmC/OhrA
MGKEHIYQLSVEWTGNKGEGTADYRSYERSHVISAKGKHDLMSSADPLFKGEASRWNPEELLLASLSACHLLWYLHLCSVQKIVVTKYQDQPTAEVMFEPTGEGRIKEAILKPVIIITDARKIDEANHIHEEAHKKCLITNSVNFPVKISPTITGE